MTAADVSIMTGFARRQAVRTFTTPQLLIPLVLFPLLLFTAFVGSASAISKNPNFHYYNYTAFEFVYVLMQSAGSSGVATGIAVAQDFEQGFARRVLLATPRRVALLGGIVVSGIIQQLWLAAVLLVVALAAGMSIRGSAIDVIGMFVLALLFNIAGTLYATGVAFRAQTTQVGPALQLPILLPLFFAPVYAPRSLLTNWLHHVANWNPVTPLLEAGRGLLAGEPVSVPIAYGIVGGAVLLLAVFALTGLRRVERE
jgi:ABC-type multidrug transport system permease subunit